MGRFGVALVSLLIGAVVIFIGVAVYQEVTEPDEGRVTGMNHDEAYTTISCTGKPIHCTTRYHPECWRLVYVNGPDQGDACVTEGEYRTYKLGDWFPNTK